MEGLYSALMLGFLLGIKHAIEPDHIVAVSTIAGRTKNVWKSSLAGIYWGIGHTITLLIFGLILILIKQSLSESVVLSLEFLVGIMLIYLGFSAISSNRKENNGRTKDDYGKKSLLVGSVHGLAGSAGMVLLTLSVVENIWGGFIYILIFGLGTIVGMLFFSTLFSFPFLMTHKKSGINQKLVVATGLLSIFFGLYYIYNLGFSEGLFNYWF